MNYKNNDVEALPVTRGNQVVRQLLGQVVAITFDLEKIKLNS